MDTSALNDTLNALLVHLQTAATAGAGGAPPSAPVYDLYENSDPFNLGTRVGQSAFEQSCKPLDVKWDGNAESFPAFILALADHARDYHWNATDATGITTVKVSNSNKDIFTDYHDIKDTHIEAAYTARKDNRAIQNAKAMYKCIKSSLTGDAKTSIFDTPGNAPDHNDGVELLLKVTKLSTLSSIQLSIKALNSINSYSPATRNFEVPEIIKDLNGFFILANTGPRKLTASEKIQYLLTILDAIQQPVAFHRFIERQQEEFEKGAITKYINFANDVTAQYHKVKGKDANNKFNGSLTTEYEDVVAMHAKIQAAATAVQAAARARPRNTTNTNRNTNTSNTGTAARDTRGNNNSLPPFISYTKTLNKSDAQPHKVGDTRDWNNKTWYYCDAPHVNNAHWHTHPTSQCNVRKRWEERGKQDAPPPTANVGETEVKPEDDASASTASTLTASTDSSAAKDVTALLCTAFENT